MKREKVTLALVLLFGFLATARPIFLFDFPLSWDVWYHIRVADSFARGEFFWDHGSFAPEGRPHAYPPLFHVLLALLSRLCGSTIGAARYLPPFLFGASLFSFYLFSKRITGKKTALIATLLSSATPILLDRGLAPTPEVLSFPFLFLGLMLFYERKMLSVLFFLLVLLTHGLTFISCVSTALLFSFSLWVSRKDASHIRFVSKVFLMLFLVSSPYLLSTYLSKTSFPYGGRHLLSFYPVKLGWVTLALSCASLPLLKKEEGHMLILSFLASNFLLSANPFLLPARFLEYMAWPLALLAAITLHGLSGQKGKMAAVVCMAFLLGLFQSHVLTEKYKPEMDSTDYMSFEWLRENSLQGSVFSSWQASPLIGAVARKPVFWGGYELTAPNLPQRKKDALTIEHTWEREILRKYGIGYIFFEQKRRDIPFDKIYCSDSSFFFVPPKD